MSWAMDVDPAYALALLVGATAGGFVGTAFGLVMGGIACAL